MRSAGWRSSRSLSLHIPPASDSLKSLQIGVLPCEANSYNASSINRAPDIILNEARTVKGRVCTTAKARIFLAQPSRKSFTARPAHTPLTIRALLSLPTVPITSALRAFAICMAVTPKPPAVAWTSTSLPCSRWTIPENAPELKGVVAASVTASCGVHPDGT